VWNDIAVVIDASTGAKLTSTSSQARAAQWTTTARSCWSGSNYFGRRAQRRSAPEDLNRLPLHLWPQRLQLGATGTQTGTHHPQSGWL